MKKNTVIKSLDADLEVVGVIVGIVILTAAVTAFLDYKDAQKIFILIFGMGALLNGLIFVISVCRHTKVRAVIFGILAVLFAVICTCTVLYY